MAERVLIAGIDVGKGKLVVACRHADARAEFDNDPAGLAALANWCARYRVAVVALEASGGYERAVVTGLQADGLVLRRLNPLRVRRFAEAQGRLAKNDRADAETIARYAATFPDEQAAPAPDPERGVLREHIQLRIHTLDAITDATNQLEHLREPSLRTLLRRRIRGLRSSLAALDRRIAERIAAAPDLAELADRLRSVPGVGPVLAQTLLALLPELGRLTRRQVASLVGVAPFDRDSGKRQGRREIQGGRAAIRNVLDMAAIVAKRHDHVIRAFAERLRGKPPKVIITACMRKLLITLNAIARDSTTWEPA